MNGSCSISSTLAVTSANALTLQPVSGKSDFNQHTFLQASTLSKSSESYISSTDILVETETMAIDRCPCGEVFRVERFTGRHMPELHVGHSKVSGYEADDEDEIHMAKSSKKRRLTETSIVLKALYSDKRRRLSSDIPSPALPSPPPSQASVGPQERPDKGKQAATSAGEIHAHRQDAESPKIKVESDEEDKPSLWDIPEYEDGK